METEVAENEHADLPPKVLEVLRGHDAFLAKTGALQVRHLVRAIREVAHADSAVAYHCWVLVFPIVWATLHKEQQVHLAKPMISLLSKEYHSRQARPPQHRIPSHPIASLIDLPLNSTG
jgi:transformation/transcription domain-associated protein